MLPVIWMAVIFILSSIPGSLLELPFPGFDKIVHFIEYFILGFLWSRVLGNKVALVIILGVFYGLFDEVYQIYVPFREFSLFDLLSDSLGVITGVACRLLLKK